MTTHSKREAWVWEGWLGEVVVVVDQGAGGTKPALLLACQMCVTRYSITAAKRGCRVWMG